jgi:hypothetical protein
LASTPPVNQEFLREVDDELRREEFKTLWERYGTLMIALLVGGLLALAGYLGWQSYQRSEAGKSGETLTTTIDSIASGKSDAVNSALNPLLASSNPAAIASAKLTQAGIAITKNDLAGAAKLFGAIAADPKLPQAYRDLGLVRQTAIEFDTMKPEAIIARLRPLVAPGKPFYGSAGEMTGLAYLKMGKTDLANATFGAIAKDEQVPQQIRDRVVQMAGGAMPAPVQPNGEGSK